ncbi:uncharacterized protein LOC131293765 [Anopheles ziemanni]|uniref:uncharacterized protein LOC131264546 n=1 Tax=Anopheles coustani TaxID=139045 RepID=UPI0026596FA1|nr:uncharacterized protein LOC131264546 [Anopheles coustani]XP_058177809.1 uncharacterized protein LOC131293765 [Anopheles ziemanni]
MVELNERHTGKFLKAKIMEILNLYEITLEQIFTVTCDNGANMIATVKQLQSELSINPLDADDSNAVSDEHLDYTETIEKEFSNTITLVRCAVHTMQLSVTDVIKAFDAEIRKCTSVSNNCRKIKFKNVFNDESLPPLYSKTRWAGIYAMLNLFNNHEDLFIELSQHHSELGKIN